MALYGQIDNRPLSFLFIIDLDLRRNGVIVADAADLVNVAAVEGAAGKGASLIDHGLNFLNLIADDVISLAPISDYLVIKDSSQHVDILIIEADGMR